MFEAAVDDTANTVDEMSCAVARLHVGSRLTEAEGIAICHSFGYNIERAVDIPEVVQHLESELRKRENQHKKLRPRRTNDTRYERSVHGCFEQLCYQERAILVFLERLKTKPSVNQNSPAGQLLAILKDPKSGNDLHQQLTHYLDRGTSAACR
eukprot:PhM_4_TR13312/c0_g2_i6/m.21076